MSVQTEGQIELTKLLADISILHRISLLVGKTILQSIRFNGKKGDFYYKETNKFNTVCTHHQSTRVHMHIKKAEGKETYHAHTVETSQMNI